MIIIISIIILKIHGPIAEATQLKILDYMFGPSYEALDDCAGQMLGASLGVPGRVMTASRL